MITAPSAARGRRAPRRPYRFGTREIALAAGKTVAAVQKDRQRGKFDPSDLSCLAAYVASTTPRYPAAKPACCPTCHQPLP